MAARTDRWVDHGSPVQADEARTAAICIGPNGESRLVIAARGYLLVVDPRSGEVSQAPFPEGLVDYPFASLASRSGLYYTGAGGLFFSFDPFTHTYRHLLRPDPLAEIAGFSIGEGPDGCIWGTTYPHCGLFRFEPTTGRLDFFGSMDETEKYPSHIAVDRKGWVYLGIGTERRNLVAFDPVTGNRRSLLPNLLRTRGTVQVYPGQDGAVYGSWGEGWFQLEAGEALPSDVSEGDEGLPAPSMLSGTGFQRVYGRFLAGTELVDFSLPEREVLLREDGWIRTIHLDYRSEGAQLAPMTAGPDGALWGTSMHPLHLYRFDPQTGGITNYGGRVVERGGGGNICAWAVQRGMLAGAAYAGGHFHLLNPSHPIRAGKEGANPVRITSHEEIHRPRCMLAHPDGRHLIWGGYAGYGAVGGGLAIYDMQTGSEELLSNEVLLPHQSTLCLGALATDDLIGGTSILAPGGGTPRAREAELYRLDWTTRRVVWQWSPLPGAREIALLQIDQKQQVHLVTDSAVYLICDLQEKRVLRKWDLSMYGGIVRDGLKCTVGGKLIGLLSDAVYEVDPLSLTLRLVGRPPSPLTAGMALLGSRLYVGAGSRLWSLNLTEDGGENADVIPPEPLA